MRLTFVNFIKRKKPHGILYRGKYGKVKPVQLPALCKQYSDLQVQENNMLILRHPYLTVEQSFGHMAGKRDMVAVKEQWNKEKLEKFSKKYTWAEQLSHLRVKDCWE